MRIVKAVRVEADEPANQPAEGGIGRRLDGHDDEPKEHRQFVGAERHPCHDAETATTATLEDPKKRSGCVQALAIRTTPSAVTISLEQMTGFGIFMIKAVLSGRGDEIVDLARTNLWR
jgi:hypothetical protein